MFKKIVVILFIALFLNNKYIYVKHVGTEFYIIKKKVFLSKELRECSI